MSDIRKVSSVLAGLALVGALVLTGCSSPSTGGGTTGGGTSGGGQSGSGGTDTSTGSPDTTGGLEGYQGLPDTFPSADVPIVDGDVPVGIDLGTGWTVIVKVADIASGYDDAKQKLVAKGFTVETDNVTDQGSVGVFTTDKYQVNVAVTESKAYGPSVNYVVVRKG